jgi:S1 RNA binding domain protein
MQDVMDKILEGKISTITNFGAFVQLENGKIGLVHISEVSNEYVKDIKDHLKEGQTVRVKVISIAPNGKIALSIKQATKPKDVQVSKPADLKFSRDNADSLSFEDRLSRFMKDSEEKIHALKKSIVSKRGTGYKRYM